MGKRIKKFQNRSEWRADLTIGEFLVYDAIYDPGSQKRSVRGSNARLVHQPCLRLANIRILHDWPRSKKADWLRGTRCLSPFPDRLFAQPERGPFKGSWIIAVSSYAGRGNII